MNIVSYKLDEDYFRQKVSGCWLGKNIGGTLGAPFERTHDHLNLDFYTQDLNGVPEPNDDLDLQLVWLEAIERHGLDRITPRVLGEFWLDFVTAGWNEYGVCCANLQNGFFPRRFPAVSRMNAGKTVTARGSARKYGPAYSPATRSTQGVMPGWTRQPIIPETVYTRNCLPRRLRVWRLLKVI